MLDSQDDMPVINNYCLSPHRRPLNWWGILQASPTTPPTCSATAEASRSAQLGHYQHGCSGRRRMAAGLAQFIANRYDGSVKDDGNLDAVESGLQAAIMSLVSITGTTSVSKTLATPCVISVKAGLEPQLPPLYGAPPDYAWVNGDLILFEDRPEFGREFTSLRFHEGMLLEANATSERIAANLGSQKASNGLGLYLPSLWRTVFPGRGRGRERWRYNAFRVAGDRKLVLDGTLYSVAGGGLWKPFRRTGHPMGCRCRNEGCWSLG